MILMLDAKFYFFRIIFYYLLIFILIELVNFKSQDTNRYLICRHRFALNSVNLIEP